MDGGVGGLFVASMPKSKRDKQVSLTRTEKKGRQLKNKLIEQIRDSIDECVAHRHPVAYGACLLQHLAAETERRGLRLR